MENDALLGERESVPSTPVTVIEPARDRVISSRTRWTGIGMAVGLLVAAGLDYLAQAGVLAGAGEIVLAALTMVPLIVAAVILPLTRGFSAGAVRRQWVLFGLGMLSVGVGNLIFIALYLITGADPYPSVADIFTLVGYGLFGSGFLVSIRAYRGLIDVKRPLLIAGAVSVLVMGFVYAAVIGPYVILDPTGAQSLATRVLNTLYPVLDVFLLFAPAVTLGLIASKLGAGRLAWPAWFVVSSASILAVTDTVFAYASFIGARRTPLIDSGYAAAPLLLGFAALVAWDVYHS